MVFSLCIKSVDIKQELIVTSNPAESPQAQVLASNEFIV